MFTINFRLVIWLLNYLKCVWVGTGLLSYIAGLLRWLVSYLMGVVLLGGWSFDTCWLLILIVTFWYTSVCFCVCCLGLCLV